MPEKPKSKKTRTPTGRKNITVEGSVTNSNVIVGDRNKIISYQSPTNDLIPGVDESERPLPLSLDFYLKVPLARLGRVFTNKHEVWRIVLAFVAAVVVYAGGIFSLRAMQGTPLPPSIEALFLYIAPGDYFYYPDWNALTFDFILNPLAVVLGIFFHQIILYYLSNLTRSGALQLDALWDRRLSFNGWYWAVVFIPLLSGVAAIAISWVSRYQHYHNDLYTLRFYVLGLIGFSTYVRTAMLISLLHVVVFLSVGAANIPLDILNSAASSKYQRIGDACLLVNFSIILIFLYALTTIYTSIAKDVYLQDDYLFWEAVVHLVFVALIFFYFNYKQIQVAEYIRNLKEDYTESKLRSETDSARHQAMKTYLSDIPNHPIWISLSKHWLGLAFIYLTELLPISLFIVGQRAL